MREGRKDFIPADKLLKPIVNGIEASANRRIPYFSGGKFESDVSMEPDWILAFPDPVDLYTPKNPLEHFFEITRNNDALFDEQKNYVTKMREKCMPLQKRGVTYEASLATPQIVRELTFINSNFGCSRDKKCLFPVVLKKAEFSKFCQFVYFLINGTIYLKMNAPSLISKEIDRYLNRDIGQLEFDFGYNITYKKEYCMTAPFINSETDYLLRYYKSENEDDVPINFRIWKEGHPGSFFHKFYLNMSDHARFAYYNVRPVGLDGSGGLKAFVWEKETTTFSVICQYDPIDRTKIAQELQNEETLCKRRALGSTVLAPEKLCEFLNVSRNYKTFYDNSKEICIYLSQSYIIGEMVTYYDDLSKNCLSTYGYPARLANFVDGVQSLITMREMELDSAPFNIPTAIVVGAMHVMDPDIEKETTWYHFGDIETGIEGEINSDWINRGITYDMLVEWERRRRINDTNYVPSVYVPSNLTAEEQARRMQFPFLAIITHISNEDTNKYARKEKNITKFSKMNLTPLRFDFFRSKNPMNFLCQFGPEKRDDNPMLNGIEDDYEKHL